MKILIISQYFYPENFRINQLAIDLKERGHDVSVLTGKPNYPNGIYYDGYSYFGNEDEVWNDMNIYRVPLRARKTGSLNLCLNYLSFVVNASKRLKYMQEDFDLVYVFEVSPITVAIPAIRFCKRKKLPLIMNVQDLWPENIIAITGINNPIIIGLVNKLVNYIYNNCDKLLCASPSFVEKIDKRINNKQKIHFWPQYATVDNNYPRHKVFNDNRFNIVFTGNIGEAQGLDIAIEAANILKNENIHWHFIGDGRNRVSLEAVVEKYGLEEIITFHGYKPEIEIPNYLTQADAALLILKPDPIFEMTIPAKLQTYLSCGAPIIGCVQGESKAIITASRSGITADDVTVDALVDACLCFLEKKSDERETYSLNALKYSEKYYDKVKLLNCLEKYMEDLL